MKSLFENKKNYLVLFICLIISNLSFAQEHFIGLKVGVPTQGFGEFGIGYGYAKREQGGIPDWIVSPTLGMEYSVRAERKIYAPKFSIEAHLPLVGARLNLIDYQTQEQHDWRLRPEAGLSLLGIVNVFYGYNIALSGNQFAEVQPHKLSICINLPLLKL